MRQHTTTDTAQITVIGAGLAGTEAALTLADAGMPVTLHEMRPEVSSPAHHSADFAELVCSNSFKGTDPASATGELKRELDLLGSRLLAIARQTAVPAGAALAVDRAEFSNMATAAAETHPLITVIRGEATAIPDSGRVIVATGPLTSDALSASLSEIIGESRLGFFDAAAPIVAAESLNRDIVFAASRYDKGKGADYLNCPLDRDEYERFLDALLSAERVTKKEFERGELFQACQPIEEVARTGPDAIRFGPLKPVGLTDPRTGERPYAVIQLRAENRELTAYNLVGFQTNLTFGEQKKVFSLIPGLESAEFLRFGVMHRNTFVDAPRLLTETFALRQDSRIRIAGQLSGTEGYLEAIATGRLTALNAAAEVLGHPYLVMPRESALGALTAYATNPETKSYQPMHVNWGLVPPLETRVKGKRERYAAYAERAYDAAAAATSAHPLCPGDAQ